MYLSSVVATLPIHLKFLGKNILMGNFYVPHFIKQKVQQVIKEIKFCGMSRGGGRRVEVHNNRNEEN